MGKIIIHNTTNLSDEEAVDRVLQVFKEGNISTTRGIEHPCHVVTFQDNNNVYCRNRGKNKNTFYVHTGNYVSGWIQEH